MCFVTLCHSPPPPPVSAALGLRLYESPQLTLPPIRVMQITGHVRTRRSCYADLMSLVVWMTYSTLLCTFPLQHSYPRCYALRPPSLLGAYLCLRTHLHIVYYSSKTEHNKKDKNPADPSHVDPSCGTCPIPGSPSIISRVAMMQLQGLKHFTLFSIHQSRKAQQAPAQQTQNGRAHHGLPHKNVPVSEECNTTGLVFAYTLFVKLALFYDTTLSHGHTRRDDGIQGGWRAGAKCG